MMGYYCKPCKAVLPEDCRCPKKPIQTGMFPEAAQVIVDRAAERAMGDALTKQIRFGRGAAADIRGPLFPDPQLNLTPEEEHNDA